MTMQVIQHIELGSAQSSITFMNAGNIPDTYTDLMVQMSLRSAQADIALEVFVAFNGSTSGFSARQLFGSGSSVGSSTPARQIGLLNGATSTSSVFANATLYIPNYRSSVAKSYSADSVTENNATTAYQNIVAGLWTGTDPITSITISNTGGNNFVAGSSATLYGITKGSDGTTTVS